MNTKAVKPDLTQEEPINVDTAARLLGLRRSTLYALTSRRAVPHYKRGGRIYFLRTELIAWIKEGRRTVINDTSANAHLRQLGKEVTNA